jgi:DNA-binding HxlR family transcriptional regulator
MSEGRMRAGAQLLLMAADPINRGILRSVLERPLEIAPGHRYEVSEGGREMLFVAFVVERWLQGAPEGPLSFDSGETEQAVVTLAEGWSATVMHVLARGPHTFAELHQAADDLSHEELRHHLSAMGEAGLVESLVDEGHGTIYAATEWLRTGISPLIASARLERKNPREDMAPIDNLDVEAGFMLSLPQVELPKELTGICRLGLNLDESERTPMTGVTTEIDQGMIVSCVPGLDLPANAWAAGTASQWLDTVIEPDIESVRTGGDRWLTRALLAELHEALFGIRTLPFQNKT